MPYIHYEYDPNDPKSKKKAQNKAINQYVMGIYIFFGLVGGAIYYIYSIINLFNGNFSKDVFFSTGFIILMSAFNFLFINSNLDNKTKKENAKRYFLFFFGGLIDLSGIISSISSINSLCHYGTGTVQLICSIIIVVSTTSFVILIDIKNNRNKVNENPSKNSNQFILYDNIKNSSFSGNSVTKNLNYIYCHKCGKCLSDDSIFCSSCGAKLR